jgi:hypothetical protein
MEKLTITRIGPVKEIPFTNKKTGKPDSFKKVGIQTNEYGDRWMDVAFRGEVPVEVGKSYEFTIKEREYNGKTYYDAELPRTNKGGGMSGEQFERLMNGVNAANTNSLRAIGLIQELARELKDSEVLKDTTSDGSLMPNFGDEELPAGF